MHAVTDLDSMIFLIVKWHLVPYKISTYSLELCIDIWDQ